MARLLGSDFSLVGRYEADATLTHVASHPLELLSQLGPRTVLDGDDLASVVQRSGKPTCINYDDAPGPVAALARELGVRCAVGAPILVDDQIWGVMAAGWALPGKASSEAAERTAEFTELVATALANTESRNEITRLAEEQAALRRVATLVARGAPPAEVFESVVTEVGQLFPGANAAALSRYETDDTLTMIGRWSRADGYVPVGARYPLVEGTVGSLIDETRRPGRVDVDAEAFRSLPAVIRDLGWVSVVGAPIFVEGRLWGLVGISSTTEQSLPSNTEQRLTEFTELVGRAIANAESREALARLADEQAALLRVATLVASGVEPGALFDAIAGEVDALFGVDISAVVRFEDDGTVTVMGANGGPHSPGARVQLDPDYIVAAVYRTQQAARFDFEDSEGEPPAVVREWRCVPHSRRRSSSRAICGERSRSRRSKLRSRLEPTGVSPTSARWSRRRSRTHSRESCDRARRGAGGATASGDAGGARRPAQRDLLGCERGSRSGVRLGCGVLRFEDGSAVIFVGVANVEIPLGTRWEFQEGMTSAEVYRTGRPARVEAVDWSAVGGPVGEASRRLGTYSTVGSPIVVEGRLWGAMIVSSRRRALAARHRGASGEVHRAHCNCNRECRDPAELAASRARIVATADATRRRIERDLHDGAQQQLVSLALELRAAQAALPSELNEQRAELSRVVEGLTAVLDELREISSGIHPAILSEGGLAPALKTLRAGRRSRCSSMSVSKVGFPRARRSLPTTSSQKRSRTQRSTHMRRVSTWTWREPTECWVSRSETTAWAAPIPRAARARRAA